MHGASTWLTLGSRKSTSDRAYTFHTKTARISQVLHATPLSIRTSESSKHEEMTWNHSDTFLCTSYGVFFPGKTWRRKTLKPSIGWSRRRNNPHPQKCSVKGFLPSSSPTWTTQRVWSLRRSLITSTAANCSRLCAKERG